MIPRPSALSTRHFIAAVVVAIVLLTWDGTVLGRGQHTVAGSNKKPTQERCSGQACVDEAQEPELTPDDKEAEKDADEYFASSPENESDLNNPDLIDSNNNNNDDDGEDDGEDNTEMPLRPRSDNLTWPGMKEDYVALSKNSAARRIFNDQGKNIFKDRKALPVYPTAVFSEPPTQGIHVITTFFHGSYSSGRMSEIVATLAANLENPYIDYVHTLWEKENPASYLITNYAHLLKKLVSVEVKRQPTYSTMFKYANLTLARGSIAIITNADIYFTSSLRCIVGPKPDDKRTGPKDLRRVYALSRRHTQLCGLYKADHGNHIDLCKEYVHSHDAFVFAPPVADQVIARTNHPQNRYGGENIVIWEFVLAGYRALNPCKKIHAIHLHCSAERHYATTFIDGSNHGTGPYRHGVVYPGTMRYSTDRRGWHKGEKVDCGTVIW